MASEIVMPQLGLTMTEGAVTTWLKQPGERVQKGEVLFTVETDKVEMEVESTATGYLQSVLVGVGEMVKVGTVIAKVGETPDAVRAVASPRARKLAQELGIELSQVKPARGTRVVEEDVRLHAEQAGKPSVVAERPGVKTSRQRIAERLSASFREAPHFYVAMEVNASELVRLRAHVLNSIQERSGVRVTYTDFFLMALARSLAGHPGVNACWRDGSIVRNASVDIGIAVQAQETLLVPVIRNADKLNLAEMTRQRGSLAEKARTGSLAVRDVEGGSATLSNLGQYGVDWFQGILNPPQSVILSTGRIAKRPVVNGDRIEVRDALTITLSADHRVVDGVAASQFLGRVRELIENPYVMLL
jgi:pyruvate dehydrogenase E2 component (dihydrolipoamide acetyltransferase)